MLPWGCFMNNAILLARRRIMMSKKNSTPDYENDTYDVLQYKSHLRNEFLIPLKANGDGTGVAAIRLQSLETQSIDRKSTRLNSSHVRISYAVFCLKKKKI